MFLKQVTQFAACILSYVCSNCQNQFNQSFGCFNGCFHRSFAAMCCLFGRCIQPISTCMFSGFVHIYISPHGDKRRIKSIRWHTSQCIYRGGNQNIIIIKRNRFKNFKKQTRFLKKSSMRLCVAIKECSLSGPHSSCQDSFFIKNKNRQEIKGIGGVSFSYKLSYNKQMTYSIKIHQFDWGVSVLYPLGITWHFSKLGN